MAPPGSEIGLDVSYPALPTQVAAVRRAVRDVALGCGADEETLVRLELVVSEAATNVVVHAYRERGMSGSIHVTARIAGGALEVCVGDDGVGMSSRPDSPGLGVGLSLMASESDRFEVRDVEGGGTRIVMRFELGPRGSSERRRRFVREAEARACRRAPDASAQGHVPRSTSSHASS